jgi:hypothetical protein
MVVSVTALRHTTDLTLRTSWYQAFCCRRREQVKAWNDCKISIGEKSGSRLVTALCEPKQMQVHNGRADKSSVVRMRGCAQCEGERSPMRQ